MAIEFSKTIGLVAAVASAAKRLADAREEVKVNEVAINLQGVVLDLQSEMMMIQSDYQNILRSKEDLEKKLVEHEKWDNERARYHLETTQDGNFVYALNTNEKTIEPAHWLCTNCYEEKKKSILQRNPYPKWLCPRCKTQVVIMDIPDRKS